MKYKNTHKTLISFHVFFKVAHTFLLGDKYSKPLNAVYLSKDAQQTVLQMGSYGIGLTRLIAAAIEVLSLEQEMRWPDVLVPFSVVIIPPKVTNQSFSLKLHYIFLIFLGWFEGRKPNEKFSRKII